VRVVFFGDSLTAGLGLAADEAFPAVLGRSLTDAGLPVTVVNAGVSGDTTAGGLARLDWTLSQKPDVFVLELGGNDMLRGLPVADAKANLHAIAEKALASGAAVVLAGMRANPSLGPDYVAQFDRIYPDLAKELGVPILPFVLEGVAGDPALTQADGLHPTAEGHRRIAERLLPVLQPVVTAKARTP
jgi:acyl-CoA thioesterase-1